MLNSSRSLARSYVVCMHASRNSYVCSALSLSSLGTRKISVLSQRKRLFPDHLFPPTTSGTSAPLTTAIPTGTMLLLGIVSQIGTFVSAAAEKSDAAAPSDISMAFVPKFDNLVLSPFDQPEALSGTHAARKELGHQDSVLVCQGL